MKKYSSLIINALIFIFGCIGLGFTMFSSGFMNKDTFLYYTVQSNILAMVSALVMFIFEARKLKGHDIPTGIQFFRLLSVVSITLTFLVFSLMLTPQMIVEGNSDYLFTPGNFFVHNLVPIFALIDWCLFGKAKKLKKISMFCGLITSLYYVIFAYVCVGLGITFSGNTVPYFFLDYQTFGWFSFKNGGIGVIYWIIILALVLIAVAYLLMKIAIIRENKQEKKN